MLTSNAGFRGQQVRLLVLVTEANLSSGEACEDSIEEHVTNVLSVLMSDTTLGNVVQMFDGFAVDYTTYTAMVSISCRLPRFSSLPLPTQS